MQQNRNVWVLRKVLWVVKSWCRFDACPPVRRWLCDVAPVRHHMPGGFRDMAHPGRGVPLVGVGLVIPHRHQGWPTTHQWNS